MDTLAKHLPGYPEGNPAEIRHASTVFRTVADTLTSVMDTTGPRVNTLTSSWIGSDRDAFITEWSTFAGSVADAAGQITTAANHLNDYANQLQDIQRRYDVAVVATGVTAAVGIAFTVISFGTSDAAAAEAVAAEVAALVSEAEGVMATLQAVLVGAWQLLLTVLPRLVVLFGVNVVAQGVTAALIYPDHDPFSHINYRQALADAMDWAGIPEASGAGFAAFGAEGTLGRLGLRFAGGALGGATESMASGLIRDGRIDPIQMLFSAGSEGALAGVSGETATVLRGLHLGRFVRLGSVTRDLTPTETILKNEPALAKRTYTMLDAGRDKLGPALFDGEAKARGVTFEQVLRNDLQAQRPNTAIVEPPRWPSNYPTIDMWAQHSGVVTSIKSIDTRAASYQSANGFYNKLTNYARELDGYHGRSWGGVNITPADIDAKELIIGLPREGVSAVHAEQLVKLIERFPQLDITLVVP